MIHSFYFIIGACKYHNHIFIIFYEKSLEFLYKIRTINKNRCKEKRNMQKEEERVTYIACTEFSSLGRKSLPLISHSASIKAGQMFLEGNKSFFSS